LRVGPIIIARRYSYGIVGDALNQIAQAIRRSAIRQYGRLRRAEPRARADNVA
jgi:hypothetical protein